MSTTISKTQDALQTMNDEKQNSSSASLRELIMGFRTTQLIAVAAKLNLAEYLKDGPKTVEYLSDKIQTHPRELHRLLRALSSIGIFEEKNSGAFSNTASSELLISSTPGSLRNLSILYGEEWLWKAYSQLVYSVETGNSAFEYVFGQTLYNYLKENPIAASKFHAAMSAYSDSEANAIINGYNFNHFKTVVDVGGGQGVLLAALSKANPHLTGVVFDLPGVIEKAQTDLIFSTEDFKITYVAGDFFKEVPRGGDAYLLKSVLHNWDDASCIRILRNCRKAMTANARLIVIERVIPLGNDKSESKLFDINMLVMTGGKERTEEEYTKLFYVAGFNLRRVIPTRSSISLIEGLPI